MVGHTGIWEAAIRAVETVDRCVGARGNSGIGEWLYGFSYRRSWQCRLYGQ